jgi:ketosteroid isomerase-like protein
MNMRERQLRKEADEGKEQNKALIQRYFAAYDRGDIDGVLRFVHTSHVYHPQTGGESLGFVARRNEDAVFFRGFSRIHTTIEDQIAEGDRVVSRVSMVADYTG